MADLREGMAPDPHREPLATPGSTLQPKTPPGSELTINDDGTATFDLGDDYEDEEAGHWDNLADGMDDARRLQVIGQDLIDAIDVDKEARKRRDQQYEEGLRRTGLGDDAPGGAPFNGASRAVFPLMTEAVIDYAARVCSELLPPDGPVKASIVGTPTEAKNDRGERTARYMNYQLTEMMPSAYSEIETGFSQQGVAGAYYLKPTVSGDGTPDVEVVHIDAVHRPWNDGDFYKQIRITHEMLVDRHTFDENVRSGLWLDVVETATTSDNIEQTQSSSANDRIIGRTQPTENIDDVRVVYESSVVMSLTGDDAPLPYLVTVDEQTQRVLAIYRNWDEGDANKQRLDYLIEFPFLPWRGGYPIGFAQMIGSLSGAATGALRALLDSALLQTMATGVKLKGGTTAGGQNIRPQPGSTTEVAGSLAQDPDIRKTYQQLEFPPPSPVLFQLLGLLIDAGRGVVRTSFDEFNKMNGEMPVGTANMMIEQGLKTFGSVFGRQHRAMRRFLKVLWNINRRTITNESVVDRFGELMVTKEDFAGPMTVIPVSDPRIFTDTQRMAGAQLIAARSDAYVQKGLPTPYKVREVELNLMRSAKMAQPEQFLADAPEPTQINFAAENVLASRGLPIKAYPGQDHEAHIAGHGAYAQDPLFGSNQAVALKTLPALIAHISEHLSLWYDDAMRLATNTVLQETFKDPRITVESLQAVKGLEVQLDRLMAEVTPDVMQHAQESLGPALEVLGKVQALVQQLQPPMPMDPSVVAQQDVKRQAEADKASAALKAKEAADRKDSEEKRIENERVSDERSAALDQNSEMTDAQLEQQRLDQEAEASARRDAIAAAGVAAQNTGHDVTVETTRENNQTQLEIAEGRNETTLEVTDAKAEADLEKAKAVAKARPKPAAPK